MKISWPFRRKNYESLVLDAALGDLTSSATRKELTANIIACASAWAEAGSLLEVSAHPAIRAALNPVVISQLFWDQIASGGGLFWMRFDEGALVLERPLSAYRLAQGGGWQIQTGEPSRPVLRSMLDAEILYIPWATSPNDPYRPVAPWRNVTGRVDQEIDDVIWRELAGPQGSVLSLAKSVTSDFNVAQKKIDSIGPRVSFSGAKRGGLFVMATPDQMGRASFSADSAMGKPLRIGHHIPQSAALLREQIPEAIMRACSIPPPMLMNAPGPAIISARRNFERTIVPAKAKIVSEYLTRKFGQEVTLKYPTKHRADISTAARTVAALVNARCGKDATSAEREQAYQDAVRLTAIDD